MERLSTYGAEISPFTDDVVGFAAGYQAFWDDHRRNLILEFGGRGATIPAATASTRLGWASARARSFQLQQAIGRHVQVQMEAFYTFNEDRDNGSGARLELLVVLRIKPVLLHVADMERLRCGGTERKYLRG